MRHCVHAIRDGVKRLRLGGGNDSQHPSGADQDSGRK